MIRIHGSLSVIISNWVEKLIVVLTAL